MTREQLLAPIARWTPRKKSALLDGIATGVICIDDVIKAHGLSAEEVLAWAAAYEKGGYRGLRAQARRMA